MRCGQCASVVLANAAFCSRCGSRVTQPPPAGVREYALTRIVPSWWHYFRSMAAAVFFVCVGGFNLAFALRDDLRRTGGWLLAIGVALIVLAALARRATSWSLTSDRLIERRGLLARNRREMELADVRSIEVSRSLGQRMLGLGDVKIASAASAEFLIRMRSIPDPEQVAEMVRQARLKRLA